MDAILGGEFWRRYSPVLHHCRPRRSAINSHTRTPSRPQPSWVPNDLHSRVYPCSPGDAGSTPRLHVSSREESDRLVLYLHELVRHPFEHRALHAKSNETQRYLQLSRTILFAPFVPFIVLFCHIIETKDRTDLARLQVFVASLQLDGTVPEAVDKLRRLFQSLHSVASQYVESQTRALMREDQRQPSIGIDTYLATLGFPSSSQSNVEQEQHYPEFGSSTVAGSMSDGNSQEFQRGVNPMIWMGNGVQLQDWFYSNQEMMTLLDEFVDGSADR